MRFGTDSMFWHSGKLSELTQLAGRNAGVHADAHVRLHLRLGSRQRSQYRHGRRPRLLSGPHADRGGAHLSAGRPYAERDASAALAS
ncbi:hypothetical protein RSK60_920013 [Ralstonia solanacearum K60]|nr:hypothetical protein RSK60_920013 [Ralstonia solanacearum K60]